MWFDSALTRQLRPAAARAGITKHIGWHTFRRSLASLLVDKREAIKTVHEIPFPHLTDVRLGRINDLVRQYMESVNGKTVLRDYSRADRILREIDATVLDGYDMPPKIERRLLDFFNGTGNKRRVPFDFADYFPRNFEPYFKLSEWLTGRPSQATAKRFRSQKRDLPDHILAALTATDEGTGDDE